MPSAETNALNLAVIKRYSPAVTSVVATASYAVVYIFNTSTVTWDRLGIEGSLFVCALNGSTTTLPSQSVQTSSNGASEIESSPGQRRRRSRRSNKKEAPTPPKYTRLQEYQIMVLNRRSLDNFIIPLTSQDDIETTDKYIILRSERPKERPLPLPGKNASNGASGESADDGGDEEDEDDQGITYALWVWTDIPSTAGDKERITNVIKDLAGRVASSREQIAARNAAAHAAQMQAQQQLLEEKRWRQQQQQQQQQQQPPPLQQAVLETYSPHPAQSQGPSAVTTPQVPDQSVSAAATSRYDQPHEYSHGSAITMNTRAISLADLFQQQRNEDGGFATHVHHYSQAPLPASLPSSMPTTPHGMQQQQQSQHQHRGMYQGYPAVEQFYHQPPPPVPSHFPPYHPHNNSTHNHHMHHGSVHHPSQHPHPHYTHSHTPSTSANHQSMPPPPHYLPTPAPLQNGSGASAYPTPPPQSTQSGLPPVVNYHTLHHAPPPPPQILSAPPTSSAHSGYSMMPPPPPPPPPQLANASRSGSVSGSVSGSISGMPPRPEYPAMASGSGSRVGSRAGTAGSAGSVAGQDILARLFGNVSIGASAGGSATAGGWKAREEKGPAEER